MAADAAARRPRRWGRSKVARPGSLPFDDLSFESRLVWILGSPRTGSTWLLRLLAHPLELDDNAVGFEAPHAFRFDANAVIPLNEPYLPVHATPLLYIPFELGERPRPDEFLQNSVRRGDPSYIFSDEYEDSWKPELRRLALVRFRAQIERGAGRKGADQVLVAIKEPNGSHGAELLMSLFPSSRMIFLVRDGRDVIDSLIRANTPGGWQEEQGRKLQLDNEQRRANFVLSQSQRWVIRMEAVERAFARHPPHLRYELHYEELLAKPQATLRRLVNWLGVQRSREELIAAREQSSGIGKSGSAGGWQENLTEREQEIMAQVMDFKLAELGYPPS